MNPRYEEILAEVTIQTLERLAFIFASTEDDFETLDLDEAQTAKVSFTGPFSGYLVIDISKFALPEFAANMLGEDDEENVTAEQQLDTLKETINIICGNLLPELSDKKEVFDIKAPEIVSSSFIGDEGKNYSQKVSVNLSLDQGSCVVTLIVKEGQLPELPEEDE